MPVLFQLSMGESFSNSIHKAIADCRTISHLVNDGVEETPPSRGVYRGEGSEELFTNLDGANVGFKNWHPVAVTANGNKLGGQSDMGGLWEWTSSELAKHEGFEPMPLYPAYTGRCMCEARKACLLTRNS